MKCLIIDDEQTARMILRKLCQDIPDLHIVAEFANAIEAFKYLNKEKVDLIFLDIHMPDFSGFDFVQTLKNPPNIILTSSDKSLAIDAFEYDCIVDYLVKPVTPERLEKAVSKSSSSRSKSSEEHQQLPEPAGDNAKSSGEFYINIDRTLIKIQTDSVCVVEARGDYIHLKTLEKEFRVHTTLKKISDKLPSSQFLQVHRSYIINLSRIVDIEDNSIVIDDEVVPISRSKRPELMRRLDLL